MVHLQNSIVRGQNTESNPLITIGSNGGGKIHIDRSVITDNENSHILKVKGNTGNASMVVTNSVIWENESQLLSIDGSYNHADLSYNNIDTNLVSFIEGTDTLVWGPGNVNVDPRFVDADSGDFYILASSQMINGGVPDQTDSDGTRADIGAYPYLNDYTGSHWYVSEDGNDLTATGASDDPFRSIQAALNFGSDGDTAFVSAGTYNENLVYRRDESESVRNVSLVGESTESTIIDGQDKGICIKFPMNGYSSPLVKGFTIRNGYANGAMEDYTYNRGGGISIYQGYSPVKLRDLIIENCNSAWDGGGIYSLGSTLEMNNVHLLNNTADQFGAGILFGSEVQNPNIETLYIENSLFSNNTAGTRGGGMHVENADVNILNSSINSNSAGHGGGMSINAGSVTLDNVIVSDNASDG